MKKNKRTANIVLCTLNARFDHASLSLRLLRQSLQENLKTNYELTLAEFTINDNFNLLLHRLYELAGDIYAFSCYIWNWQLIRQLCVELTKIRPYSTIILGGPEVAFRQEELLRELPMVSYILAGEGEINLSALLSLLCNCQQAYDASKELKLDSTSGAGIINTKIPGREDHEINKGNYTTALKRISGLAWRDEHNMICINPVREQLAQVDWPFAYLPAEAAELSERLLYYESSRGCPFGCTYCLSSQDRFVRFRDLELVLSELDYFIAADVKIVKFVDRTFNCNPQRALQIWQHILAKKKQLDFRTCFHFEIAADLLNEETIDFLALVPVGLFQFEIGIQSYSSEVLTLIDRTSDLVKLEKNVIKLRGVGNIHLHLDLIAGLPTETLSQFKKGFNQALQLKPHMLQLGFLKVLSGSSMGEQAREHSMAWQDLPPYEILSSDAMDYSDLLTLKRIEKQLDYYYNSGNFVLSLNYLLAFYPSPYDLFDSLAKAYVQAGWEKRAPSQQNYWQMLLKLPVSNQNISPKQKFDYLFLRDLLVLDYLKLGHKDRPSWQDALESYKDTSAAALVKKVREHHRILYPGHKRVRVEYFTYNPQKLLKLRGKYIKKGISIEFNKEHFLPQNQDFTIFAKSTATKGWLAVFDQSGQKKRLIWQTACTRSHDVLY